MRQFPFLKYFMIAVILVSFISFSVSGNENKVITIAAYVFPPYSIFDDQEKLAGADTDITRVVLSRLGYKVKFEIFPFNRALVEMKMGTFMAMLPCVNAKERREYMEFSSVPTTTLERTFYKLKSNPVTWRKYEDIHGKTVGAADYSYDGGFWEAGKAGIINIDVNKKTEADVISYYKLINGRVDLVIADKNLHAYLIEKYKPDFDKIVEVPYRSVGRKVPFSFAISKAYWAGKRHEGIRFLDAYTRELKKYIAEGERNKIFEKYNMYPEMDMKHRLIVD